MYLSLFLLVKEFLRCRALGCCLHLGSGLPMLFGFLNLPDRRDDRRTAITSPSTG